MMSIRPATFLTVAVNLMVPSSVAEESGTRRNLRTDVIHERFVPNIFNPSDPQPILLELTVGTHITSVILNLGGGYTTTTTPKNLRDDGTNGDLVAGDKRFSLMLQPAELLPLYRSPNPSLLLGYLDLYSGSTVAIRAASNVKVLATNMPITQPQVVDAQVQAASHVANLRVTRSEFFGSAQSLAWVSSRFYQYFKDDFDFLNIVYDGALFENRTHSHVQNQVDGVGLSRFNGSGSYGSGGKLIGLNRFPNDNLFDLVADGQAFLHETAHQWINYLRNSVLTSQFPHWPLSDVAFGIMGYSNPFNGQGMPLYNLKLVPQGNDYLVMTNQSPAEFNDLELYLMGLLPASSVSQHFVFVNQDQTQSLRAGSVLLGPVTPVTIQDIIAANGARNPDASISQRQYRVGTVLVTFDRQASIEEMSWFEYGAARADAIFQQATRNVGRMSSEVVSSLKGPACGFSLASPAASVDATGGSIQVNVATSPGCSWLATSNLAWAPLISQSSNVGPGVVSFSVAPNPMSVWRTGVVQVAGIPFTVTQAAAGSGPIAGMVSPASGVGQSQTFVFSFQHSGGFGKLDVVNILMNNFLDGRSACYIAFSQPLNVLYLVDDAGGSLLPALTLGSSSTRSNSQCTIIATSSSVVRQANTLTLSLTIQFAAAFGGNKVMYLAARDATGGNSGWQSLGVWNVLGASRNPDVSALTPSRGFGSAQMFTAEFTDAAGWQNLGVLNVLMNSSLDGRSACYLAYSRPLNVLYLVDDLGASLSTGLLLNGSGSVGNGQCTISGAGTSAVGSGTKLTLTLNFGFTAGFKGNQIVHAAARDLVGTNSGWQAVGTWTVP